MKNYLDDPTVPLPVAALLNAIQQAFGASEMKDKYPRGKLNDSDEGELTMAMTVKDKTLIIDFGKPVVWVGLPLDQAKAFAERILERVRDA